MRGIGPVLLLLAACSPRALPLKPMVPFDAAPRPLAGDVRVAPIVIDTPLPGFDGRTFLGTGVSEQQALVRLVRTRQVADVPEALGLAVPGAMVEAFDGWAADLHPTPLPAYGRGRIIDALHGRSDLDATLGALAADLGGDAALFVWIDRLEGCPASAEAFPGELVPMGRGFAVVDHHDEPYRVVARTGLALVASDGEVVVRYSDTFEAVVNERSDAGQAARDLARALVAEVAALWPSDPRLH